MTWIVTTKSGQTKKCFEGRVLVPCQRAEYRQFERKGLGLIPGVHTVVTGLYGYQACGADIHAHKT